MKLQTMRSFRDVLIYFLISLSPVFTFCQLSLRPAHPNLQPNWSPDGQQIVFTDSKDGTYEIFLIKNDGSQLRQLTHTGSNETNPSFSADGSKILFQSQREEKSQVYVMNRDGSDPVNLTKSTDNEYSPQWSPDGNQIAFHTTREVNVQIYIMDKDGSSPRRVTRREYNNSYPVWSPDGKKLICSTVKAPKFINSIVYPGGDSAELFAPEDDRQYRLSCFSPDSKKILYNSIDHFSNETFGDLFIYDIETKTSKKIKSNIERLAGPKFLNEDTIMYISDGDLYLINILSGKKNKIASDVISAVASPDRNLICYVHSGKYSDICTVRKDGTGFKNLTKDAH